MAAPVLVPHPRGKSTVWTHFGFKAKEDGSIEDWKKVFYHDCGSEIGYSGNTSNLTYHWEKRHPELFTAFKEKQRINGESSSSEPR